jgi:ribonuclease G
MAKEICISSTPHETRLAILEDDQLNEIYYERENEYTLAGSIYNGRVTRVLPGMQSAFVDIGLERDAFLYVTDFIEMEDPEGGDEIERTAASAAPRPVKPGSARPDGRPEPRQESRPDSRQDQRGDGRTEGRGRRQLTEAEQVKPVEATPREAVADDSTDEEGGRRWRGRRRRRGGRKTELQASATGAPVNASDDEFEVEEQEAVAPVQAPTQRQPEREARPEKQFERRDDRGGRREERQSDRRDDRGARRDNRDSGDSGSAPAPFVLPGESLQKYGAKAEEPTRPEQKSEAAKPARPESTFKPASLVTSPIVWDGVGPLPGESISRHRKSEVAAPVVEVAPEPVHVQQVVETTEPEIIDEAVGNVEEFIPLEELAGSEILSEEELDEEEFEDEDDEDEEDESLELDQELDEDEFEEHPHPLSHADRIEHAHSVVESMLDTTTEEPGEETIHIASASAPADAEKPEHSHSADHEGDSASHNVDPLPPAEFKLFGLEIGKKKEVKPKSSYSPGKGRVEEEVIDGDEFVAKPKKKKRSKDDNDDLEEETLRSQLGSGGYGEMLHEAHLDQHIKRDLGNGEAEESGTRGGYRRDRDRGRDRGRGRSNDRSGGPRRGGPSRRTAQTTDLPIISDLLKPGQEILVQIAKEPIAKKGARITSHIALPGRFLVFMPTVSHVGVSRKISSDEERHRLKRILVHERGEQTGGFIVRTAAEGASEDELRADLRFLLHLWSEIKNRSEGSKSPALIYHDLSLIERILRDQISDDFSSIWVDSEADYERIVRFLNRFSPTLVRRVKLYSKEVPLFEHFGIEEEISKALRSKVWLKSGGSIVINQTEALVAIDINTGKYVGKTARLEDTILKTNLDAIPEIVRQVRLRDLGGIIVIDFIDMDERKNRNKVMTALEDALKVDRAPTKVLQFNDFGLVAITRKRVKQSLERTLSVPCATCQATGMVKSPMTVANEIFIELRKMRKNFESRDVMIRVHPETVKVLKGNNARWIADYEELVGKSILIKSDLTLHPEQYDIQG